MKNNLKIFEREYVTDKMRISPIKLNQLLSPPQKRTTYKQFVEKQKKILSTKYPFLSNAQIQKKALSLWKEVSRKDDASCLRKLPKKERPSPRGGLKTFQSWISSVRIENKVMISSTPQTTPKLPLHKRRPPTPKASKMPYQFDFDISDEEELRVEPKIKSGESAKFRPRRDVEVAPNKNLQNNEPSNEDSKWIGENSSSAHFKVRGATKRYSEGSMRSAFSSALKPPKVIEEGNSANAKGILLRQETPKSKTFRVSFSDMTSIITFEKTSFEKEAFTDDTDAEPGYTLRSKQLMGSESVYSLRTRTVPESPKSLRSPLVSPLVSLPLRSPRRSRKREEEEIRRLDLQLSAGKNRKWIPLLPTTPPLLVRLKGTSSLPRSSEQSEPESPYPSNREKNTFPISPTTPTISHSQDNTLAVGKARLQDSLSKVKTIAKRNGLSIDQNSERDASSPNQVDDDFHLELSSSASDDSSPRDLSRFDRKGRVIKNDQEKGSTNISIQHPVEVNLGVGEVVKEEAVVRTQRLLTVNDDDMDHYSTASEESKNNEVFYDASGYDADDSDDDRDQQLFVQHSHQHLPVCGQNVNHQSNIESNRVSKLSVADVSKKQLKQKYITQYFVRSLNMTKDDTEQIRAAFPTNLSSKPMDSSKSKDDSNDGLQKVSVAVSADASNADQPLTPKTQRRLLFRDVAGSFQGDKFFHTPQTRRMPLMRQTPSRTAPALVQRRRSSRLQAKLASDNPVTKAVPSKFRGLPSADLYVHKRSRPPKNMMSTTFENKRKKEGTDTHAKHEDKAILPFKFYGTRSKTNKRNSKPKPPFSSDDKDGMGRCANMSNGRGRQNETKLNTKKKKKISGRQKNVRTTRFPLSNINANIQGKRMANQLKSVDHLEGWNIFESSPKEKPLLPLMDNFFESDSSPLNCTFSGRQEGIETVERTVQSMREAAMSGSFTSPFRSSPKLSKLLGNCHDNFCHETFSDGSCESFNEERQINIISQEIAKTTSNQVTSKRDSRSTSGVQTLLSDMFGDMTPPDRPKRTIRRLCISGQGKDENNFSSMFDATGGGEDNIFM